MTYFSLVLQICVISFNIVFGERIEDNICSGLNLSDLQPTKDCPSLQNADSLTRTQLIFRLTSPCRYDRFQRPFPIFENKCSANQPLHITVQLYIYAMEIVDSSAFYFKISGFLQLRYKDFRLAFGEYAPNRAQTIFGDIQVRERFWDPQILIANANSFAFPEANEKHVSTIVMPDGKLSLSTRIETKLSCSVALSKFPFDDQQCSAVIESWMYNSSQLILQWGNEGPIVFDQNIKLTDYGLQDWWTNESVLENRKSHSQYSLQGGDYSSLSFTFYLTRDTQFYAMAYFLPSIMLVCISWVSFWLQADQTPARTTLGTSTILSLFTLTFSYRKQIKSFSYPQFFEAWFFCCTFFIFGSLIEFAFVNTIWRRNRCLELKKVNSKYILKSTLTPKTITQKNLYDCKTDGNINCLNEIVSELHSRDDGNASNFNPNKVAHDEPRPTMTPHEVSLWIDRKARFVFPLLFIIFNAIFWALVFCLE